MCLVSINSHRRTATAPLTAKRGLSGKSYWEDPRYVPLLLRAYELWRRLEVDTGQALLHITGGLMIGRAGGDLVARKHGKCRAV